MKKNGCSRRMLVAGIGAMLLLTNVTAQSGKGFVLKGKIDGLKDGSLVSLLSFENDTLSKTISKGARFVLKGILKQETGFYFLSLDTAKYHSTEDGRSNTLWLVNEKMELTGKINSLKQLHLKGSEVQHDWEEFKNLQDRYVKEAAWPAIPAMQEYIDRHTNSLFAPIVLRMQPPEIQNKAYEHLSERVKQSAAGQELAKLVDRNHAVTRFAARDSIPDFKFSDRNGDSVSILSVASKHKYTLIDFWASWCGPCRASFPKLDKVYQKFNSKGFNIVGISLDEKKPDWLKALEDENPIWFQGLDNLDEVSKNIFGIKSIPGYLLIDSSGKIIQSQIRSFAVYEQIQTYKGKSLVDDLQEMLELLLKEK
ncbi:thiol-disulfide isomerase/thioredoxin [Pseudobacter ginsenosidimutans]|uniref:Thiol-disulfide isomerase/thioredoxin n=2 Tax=Pseudobacter ginsenosidimutans TaxID=661488 RepID=A0A4Q7N4Z3_9BACT|nr:thiol-disulfide isomerase/thioredoxin [Pseudobacter ginsenosidimutans]